jgi:hypothetical protein
MAGRLIRWHGVVAVVSVLAASPALACTITCTGTSCTCAPDAGQCNITTDQTVPANAVITCPSQVVRLTSGGSITVTGGFVTLRATSLLIDAQHRIEANAGPGGGAFGIVIDLSGTLGLSGSLRANGSTRGGSVSVRAEGTIWIEAGSSAMHGIVANGTASGAGGGVIALESKADVIIDDSLLVEGSTLGTTDGGDIMISAANVTIRDTLSTFASGGDAGEVTVTGSGTVDVQHPIELEGRGTEGDGGRIQMTGERIILGARLSAQGGVGVGGGDASGGVVALDAGSLGIAVNGDIDASGGGQGGGSILAESLGPITIANGVTLDTKADANGGDGGPILLRARGELTIGDATLDARGNWQGGQGSGAEVELDGCDVSVATGATVDARGYTGGTIRLLGRETVTVSASSAVDVSGVGGAAGTTELRYRVLGKCGANPTLACVPAQCLLQGTCSNDPARPCHVDADCTVGCTTGQCQGSIWTCSNAPTTTCATDGDCTGCGTDGPCNPNPNTGGTTAQFHPTAPTLTHDPSLVPCP